MAEVVPRRNRANRRRAQSFESLVQAGFTIIGKRGLSGATIEDITEAADVGKGTFYAHFPSKEDLVYHLVRHGFDELIAAGRAETPAGRTAADRLAGLIRVQSRVLSRRRDLVVLLHQVRGLLLLQSVERQRLRREHLRYVQFLADECRRALKRTQLSPGEARELGCAIAGFVASTLSFEMLVCSGGATQTPPRDPIRAFAEGMARRYVPNRRSANGGRPR
jgi:AcrR family transcriptional regulator